MTTLYFIATIPPVTVNKMYATIRGRRVLSKDGREYKRVIGWLAKDAMGKQGFLFTAGRVEIHVALYLKTWAGDIDNYLKALLDALTGVVYKDDSQIMMLHVTKDKDAHQPRTDVKVIQS